MVEYQAEVAKGRKIIYTVSSIYGLLFITLAIIFGNTDMGQTGFIMIIFARVFFAPEEEKEKNNQRKDENND